MSGETFLPPVVISIAVNSTAATAGVAKLKGTMAGLAASVDASSAGIGRSTGTISKNLGGMGTGAVAGASRIKAAEGEAESASKSFAGRMAMTFESLGNSMGSFGIPFGNSVKKMGYSMKEGESAAKGFGSTLLGVSKIAAVAGLAIVAGIAVAGIKAVDTFDVATTKLKSAITGIGQSFKTYESEIKKTDEAGVRFGSTAAETNNSLSRLVVATKSTSKATADMGLVWNLVALTGKGQEDVVSALTKLYGGSTRALTQLGIQLNIGSTKLAAYTKATEAVTKAKATLKTAEEGMVVAQKKGEEEHAKAIEKVTVAQETLKHAQESLSADSGSLTAAQEALRTAQKGVTEAAEKQKTAIKEAAAALKAAEQSARETAEAGAKGVEGAKKNLSNLETERAKESNEAGIKTIESEEKVLEAIKTTASEAALVQLHAKKAGLEATDKGIEATKKEDQLQIAHKGIIEAEATAHKNNTKAISAVTKAHDVLIQKQKQAMASSRENVTAHHAVDTAARALANTEVKLSRDQKAVAKAQRGVSQAQTAAAQPPKALAVAQDKLTKAHEALSKAQNTVKRDSGALGEVLSYLAKISAGAAEKGTHTLAGQMKQLKAEVTEAERSLATGLMPTLLKLTPAMKSMVPAISFVGAALANAVVWWQGLWEKIGMVFYKNTYGIKTVLNVLATVIKTVVGFYIWYFKEWITNTFELGFKIGLVIRKIIGFFISMPGKLVSVIGDMWNLGKNIVKALVNGIISAPGAIIKAIKGLIPGSGVVGEAIESVLHLASGGIVTKPTLAVIGEDGPEAVIPLKGGIMTGRQAVAPLSAPQQSSTSASSGGGGGLHIENLSLSAPQATNAAIVNELYLRLRPLLQSAA